MATNLPVTVDELYGELSVSATSDRWQVIHVKPQREKKLADYLKKQKVYYYLPMLDSVRQYKYRKITFTKPMFPGYLFARFDTVAKPSILVSGYVVSFLKVFNEEELLHDLNQIQTGRAFSAEMQQSAWLERGWQVEIISGPMQGMQGIVNSQSNLEEVNLQVNILRQAISVKVKSSDVRITGEFNHANSSQDKG